MIAYALKRLVLLGFILFGITLLTFGLIHMAPGDPSFTIAEGRYGTNLTPEQVEQVRAEEGFDDGWWVQYQKWVGHLLELDMGRSLVTYKSVTSEIAARIPYTFVLAFTASIITFALSIPMGIASAVRKGRRQDVAVRVLSLVAASMPNFWLGLLLIWVFAVVLGVLPSFGAGGVAHLILPAFTLGISMAAINTRLVRSAMIEVLSQEYIATARMKGLDEWTIISRHGLKNALLPVLTFAGLQLGFLLGGAVVVETVFSWPGIGKLLVDSIMVKDFSMIQGCVLVIGATFAIINIGVDLAYAAIDPRIRWDVDA